VSILQQTVHRESV